MDRLILDLCLKQFNNLPKTGKPSVSEWTILSCIVKQHNSIFEVVALGTGSKCIGKSKMCPKGTVINDSHAEIMCRRAFVKYLYKNLQKDSVIFTFNETAGKFSLNPSISFHFFTTHVPCGDAAICPKLEEDFGAPLIKKRKIEDINRTGAKCINQNAGIDYHLTGVVRTKPGRGDPTASVSCSDKLAKWCHLGIQGALLMNFLDKPIYLDSLILIKDCNYSQDALERALYTRLGNVELIGPYSKHVLQIYEVKGEFQFKKIKNKVACASSIAWCKNDLSEAAVNGRKQGVTKKHLEKGKLTICKLELFKMFLSKCKEFDLLEFDANMSYGEAKNVNKTYQDNWQRLKVKFDAWTIKDLKSLDFRAL